MVYSSVAPDGTCFQLVKKNAEHSDTAFQQPNPNCPTSGDQDTIKAYRSPGYHVNVHESHGGDARRLGDHARTYGKVKYFEVNGEDLYVQWDPCLAPIPFCELCMMEGHR